MKTLLNQAVPVVYILLVFHTYLIERDNHTTVEEEEDDEDDGDE